MPIGRDAVASLRANRADGAPHIVRVVMELWCRRV